MDITYLGHSCFKIKTKTATLVTDPFDPEYVGFKFPPTDAEIVTVSHNHKDHNMTGGVSNVKKTIDGPGEYEISGVSVVGYPSFHDDKKGEDRGKNTIYVIEAEGLRVVHLGDLGHDLSDALLDDIGSIDILLVPIGGIYTIGSKTAASIVSKLEPAITIPMHYQETGINSEMFGSLEPKDDFLKECGKTVEILPKLSIKKADLTEDVSPKVVVLERKSS